MKSFELSSKNSKNGQRHFKVILHEIYPDSCVDESTGEANQYNGNGITWIREYCENALDTLKGQSIRCEFLDDERTEIHGHGKTGDSAEDNLPIFENAVVIGQFEKGYITDIETPEGTKTVCIGEGTIDGLCYHNFVMKLEKDIEEGNAPYGSVEILRTADNPGIVYKYGYKEWGRIPMVYSYSGFALLGIRPADQTARILELNNSNKEDKQTMDENAIKAIVSQVIGELNSSAEEVKTIREECEAKIADAQAHVTESENTISELNAKITELEATIATMTETANTMTAEMNELKASLEEAQKKEKIGELNEAIKDFSDEEKEFAKAEIDAFTESPLTSEINSVVNKICVEIVKRNKAASVEDTESTVVDDIFAEVCQKTAEEEIDIF